MPWSKVQARDRWVEFESDTRWHYQAVRYIDKIEDRPVAHHLYHRK